jgi:hypothetical protein
MPPDVGLPKEKWIMTDVNPWLYSQQLRMLIRRINAVSASVAKHGAMQAGYQRVTNQLTACRENLSWGGMASAHINLEEASRQLDGLVAQLSHQKSHELVAEHARLTPISQDLAGQCQSWPF